MRVATADLHVEVVTHLIDESHLLAGELAARTGQCPQVGGDEVGTVVGESTGARDVRQGGEQTLGLGGQAGRIGCRLVGDLAAQPCVAGEGVDVAFLDPVEPQTEQQVLADEVVGLHGVHASCKT
jgi:hypothetical protein